MKILFFIETLNAGGAEKVLCDLVNHMDQSQFDITVQTVWPCDAEQYLSPGIQYKSIYPVKNRWAETLYRIEAAAKLTYPLHIKDDYDIECAYLEFGPTKILAASTNKKAKKLAWVHCPLSQALKDSAAFEAKAAPWYRSFDSVVCVSQSVKEDFDRIFHSAFPTEVVYNVVDDRLILEKSEEAVPSLHKRRLTMLAVGRLCAPKNIPRLIRTHEKLLHEGIEHDLWLLGDGEQKPWLEQYVTDHGLTDSVTLFGFQKNPYPYLKAADLVVCSSNYEGFSTIITESTVLGKAIVTTDCSGMREILGDSAYGLITANTDEAFCEGVRTMLTDPELRREYAEKAAMRGRRFSMPELVSRTQDYFKEILGRCN